MARDYSYAAVDPGMEMEGPQAPPADPQATVLRGRQRTRRNVPYYSGGDPARMAENDRLVGQGYSDIFNQDYGDEAGFYGDRGDEYRRTADAYYQDLMNQPGFAPDEAAEIRDTEGLNRSLTSPEDYASNFMTDDEWMGAQGNSASRGGWFNPGLLEDRANENATRRRNSLYSGRTEIRNARERGDAATRGAMDRGDEAVEAALSGTEGRVRGALDSTEGRMDSALGGMTDSLNSNASDVQSRLDAAVNDPKLQMSDAEVQGVQDQAGRILGSKYRSGLNRVKMDAAAAGTTNPLAMAELEGRYERDAAAGAADASADARIKALAAQRDAASRVAGMRLDAASTGGGFRERAGTTIGQAGLGAAETLGQMRVGAEDALGGRRSGLADSRSRYRSGLENDITARNTESETGLMGAEIGVEDTSGREALDTARFNQQFGTDIARDIDDTNVNRARYNIENRQGVNQANQNSRFNQGLAVSNARSQRGATIAGGRMAGQQEGRGYYTNQSQFNPQLGYNYDRLRVEGVGQGLNATGQGTQAAIKNRAANPSFLSRLGNAAISAGMTAATAYATGGASGGRRPSSGGSSDGGGWV